MALGSIFRWQRPRIPASEIGPIQGPMPDSLLRPSAPSSPAPSFRGRGPFAGSEYYDRDLGEDRRPAPAAAGPARAGGAGGGGGGINIVQTIGNILGIAWNAIGRPAIAMAVPVAGRPLAGILPAAKVGTVIARTPLQPPAGAGDRAGAPELVRPGGDSAARNALAADLLVKHGGNAAAAAREYNDLVHGADREYSDIVGADPRDWPEGTPGR